MVLVLDESVSVLVNQVGVETIGWKISSVQGYGFNEVLPAVAWLKASSTSKTRDTLSTWDWLVDFLHQSLGRRTDFAGGVIEVLLRHITNVNVLIVTRSKKFLPKHKQS